MEKTQRFRVVAWWASGRTGIAQSNSALNAIHFSSPPTFGGLDGRWTPQDLLLCAIASCYTTTFGAVAENSKFPFIDLQVEAEGIVTRTDTGYSFDSLVIHANLIIAQEQRAEEALAIKLLQKARGLCLISRSLAVEPRFELRVQIGETRAGIGQALPIAGKEDCR